jgi:hypothetical protein
MSKYFRLTLKNPLTNHNILWFNTIPTTKCRVVIIDKLSVGYEMSPLRL